MRLLATIIFILAFSFSAYGKEWCGAKECHGLDMSCEVFHAPQACTAIYKLGDFCRQYARCQMVGGRCQLVKEDVFDRCVACVNQCVAEPQKSASAAFDCELKCREQVGNEAADRSKEGNVNDP